MILTLIGAATLGVTAAPAPAPAIAKQSLAVRASTIHLGDGKSLEDGVLWIENGKIRAIGRGVDPPAGVPVIEHGGVLTAGLVAAHSYTGGGAELTDSTRAFLPDAEVRYAFDPDHSDFDDALAAGVTSLVLAPRRTAVAGGMTAVVKCAGGKVIADTAHLHLSLETTALWGWREPTSWPGAIAELDRRLAAGEGAFGRVKSGDLPVIVEAWKRHEVSRALDFAIQHKLEGALRGASRAGEMAERVAASGMGVIAGPFGVGEDTRNVSSVVKLAEAGVPIAFALQSPANDPRQMRMTAAMCVRAGLDAAVAWDALTSTAADLAGVGDRVGRLEKGRDADFVLWSGPPLELTSRVEAVYVDGARVDGGDQ